MPETWLTQRYSEIQEALLAVAIEAEAVKILRPKLPQGQKSDVQIRYPQRTYVYTRCDCDDYLTFLNKEARLLMDELALLVDTQGEFDRQLWLDENYRSALFFLQKADHEIKVTESRSARLGSRPDVAIDNRFRERHESIFDLRLPMRPVLRTKEDAAEYIQSVRMQKTELEAHLEAMRRYGANVSYQPQDNTIDAEQVLSLLKTVDGSGSGLDADTLDGVHLEDITADNTGTPMGTVELGNNDWTRMLYDVRNGTALYHAGAQGVILSGTSVWAKLRIHVPIAPTETYYCRIKVYKRDGDGRFYAGAISLDNNFTELSTDSNEYSYFVANDVVLPTMTMQTLEGTISGYNVAGGVDHKCFDPEANYFDLVFLANYGSTGTPTETVIASIELRMVQPEIRFPSGAKLSSTDDLRYNGQRVWHEGNDDDILVDGGNF